jgi:hypothetical protein
MIAPNPAYPSERMIWDYVEGRLRPAQGIEAASAAKTTQIGLAEGESPVAKPCAQTSSQPSAPKGESR